MSLLLLLPAFGSLGFFALLAATESRDYIRAILDRGAGLIEQMVELTEIELLLQTNGPDKDFVLSAEAGVLWGVLNTGTETGSLKKPIVLREWDLLRDQRELHFAIFDSSTGETLLSDEPLDFASFRVRQILETGPQIRLHSVFSGYTSPSSIVVDLQDLPAQPLRLAIYLSEAFLPLGSTSINRLLFALFLYFFLTLVLIILVVDRLVVSRIRSLQGLLPYFEKFLFENRPLDPTISPDGGADEIGTYSRGLFTLLLQVSRRVKELRSQAEALEFREKKLSTKPQELFSFLATELMNPVQILNHTPELFRDLDSSEEQESFLLAIQEESQKLWSITRLIRSLGPIGTQEDASRLFRYQDFVQELKAELALWSPQRTAVVGFIQEVPDLLAFDLNPLLLAFFWRIVVRGVQERANGTEMSLRVSHMLIQESSTILRFDLRFLALRGDQSKYSVTEGTGIYSIIDLLRRHDPVFDFQLSSDSSSPPHDYRLILDLRTKEVRLPQTLGPQKQENTPPLPSDLIIENKIRSTDSVVRTEGLHLLLDLSRQKGWLKIEQYVTLCLFSDEPTCPYLGELLELIDDLRPQEPDL